MQKALELVKIISKQLDKNWLPELQEINLHKTFEPVYRLEYNIITLNTLVCAIIYSYDNESQWIDLKWDGFTINKHILEGLNADINEEIFKEFIELKNQVILYTIGSYLDLLADWKFVTARKQIDFHAKYIRESEPMFATDFDVDKKIKARENIGKLIREAISQRLEADKLLEQINKEYVKTQHRVQQDFNADYVQSSIDFLEPPVKKDILSWRQFVKYDIISKK